jgi:hypothetical protein
VPSPLFGVVSWAVFVVVGLTFGTLVLINARRLSDWADRNFPHRSRRGSGNVYVFGGLLIFVGLFSILGVLRWAAEL